MSFILDALRKSEHERRRDAVPGLAGTRQRAGSRRGSPWLAVLAVVLLANAILLAVLLWRGQGTGQPAASVALPARTAPAPAVPPAAPRPPAAVRSLASEVSEPDASTADSAGAGAPAPASPPAVQAPAAAAPAAALTNDPGTNAPGTVGTTLPSLQQLALAGDLSLPPLRIDIHVYSEAPAQRFVFINMNKYREGDTLKEGPTLEAITGNGVIMAYQGRRFTLDRE